MNKIIVFIFLLTFTNIFSQEQKEVLDLTVYGTFNPKDTLFNNEKNCKGGFNNHIDLLFNRVHKVIGTFPNLRITTVPKNSNLKIINLGEIKYDNKSNLCSAKLKLEINRSNTYTGLDIKKEEGFISNDSAVFYYSQKLENDSIYLSYLSCINPKDSFFKLIKSAIEQADEEKTARISLTYPPESIYSNCEIVKNSICNCTIFFNKKNLKSEIVNQFRE
ncbi:MAG TPA: hypothetical protein PLX69_15580 [Leptospiraceae bacterium]|nr:hypothetical protein [Leptospiraceae bacterium]